MENTFLGLDPQVTNIKAQGVPYGKEQYKVKLENEQDTQKEQKTKLEISTFSKKLTKRRQNVFSRNTEQSRT